jgi:predicted peroxiredoxin
VVWKASLPANENIPYVKGDVNKMDLDDSEKPIEQLIKNVTQDGVKLTKNTKGYSWEISVHEDNIAKALEKAILADKRIRELLEAVNDGD